MLFIIAPGMPAAVAALTKKCVSECAPYTAAPRLRSARSSVVPIPAFLNASDTRFVMAVAACW